MAKMKRRSATSRLNPSPPPANDPDSYAAIVQECCEKALTAFTLGTPKKAFKIIKESLSRHPNSPALHRTQALFYFHLSTMTTNGSDRLKYLEKSASCAEQALSLVPNALGLHLLYNQSLLGLAKGENEYRRIIEQCERALLVESPADPDVDVEMLPEGDEEERNMQKEIEKVMEKAKIALDGCALKCGGRKGKMVSLDDRRVDKMFSLEEEPKIQEIRERDLREKMENLRRLEKGKLFGGEGRKKDGKLAMKERVLEYWNGKMSMDEKRRVLRVSVEEMIEHYSKHNEVKEILKEAVEFVKESKRWKAWKCCCCGKWFREREKWRNHVMAKHLNKLSKQNQEIVPQEVDLLWVDKIENGVWNPVDVNRTVGMHKGNLGLAEKKWIFCDDVNRRNLLGDVNMMLKLLLKHDCLTTTIMNMVIKFAVEELETAIPGLEILIPSLSKTPMCICFLGCEQLKQIFGKLAMLYSECDFLPRTVVKSGLEDDEQCSDKDFITFTSDFSSILLNVTSLIEKLDPKNYSNSANLVDETAVVSIYESTENDPPLGGDSFIHWLFTGPENKDQVKLWTTLRDSKMKLVTESFHFLETEYARLEFLCKRKCYYINHEKATRIIEDLCTEEGKKREENNGHNPLSYALLLLKRREELGGQLFAISQFELNAISNVMHHAQKFCGDRVQFAAAWVVLKRELCDLESGGDVKQRMQDMLLLADRDVTKALQKHRCDLSIQFCRLDAFIMRTVTAIRRMEQNIEWLSACDYRAILLHLLKSFVQTHLEDLVYKDVKEKADAMKETFLAELALENKKNMRKGGDDTKEVQQKSNSKKHNKRRKATYKAYGGHKRHLPLDEKSAEQYCLPNTSDDDGSNCDNTVSQQDETLNGDTGDQILEYEMLQRKLDEALAYQRQFENDAKHLAVKNVKTDRTILEKVADGVPLVHSESGNIDGLSNPEVQKHPERLIYPDGCIYFGSFKVTNFDCSWYHAQRSAFDLTYPGSGEKNGLSEHELPKNPESVKISSNASSLATGEETGDSNCPAELVDLKKSSGNCDMLLKEHDCFLSVIIQCLWRIRKFRDEFASVSALPHRHVGDPCIVCGLSEIFAALSVAPTDFHNKRVAPTSLSIALSKLCASDSELFQMEDMNDASDVLAIIFYCIHRSFASSPEFSHSGEEKSINCWDCSSHPCVAHRLFSLEITESLNCKCCGRKSRNRTYTSFFHDIKASALRQMKIRCGNSTFDELLKLVDMNYQFPCGTEAGGCGKLNYIHHFLETPPHVFMTVLGWQSTCETVDGIRETLAALTTEIDIGVLYRGSEAAKKFCLTSMVCYDKQHHCCFVYDHEQETWTMYDDALVKIVGDWADVLAACVEGPLQPHVLFFEAAQ